MGCACGPVAQKPGYLKGEAAKVWITLIDPLEINVFREPVAILLCTLWTAFRAKLTAFSGGGSTA